MIVRIVELAETDMGGVVFNEFTGKDATSLHFNGTTHMPLRDYETYMDVIQKGAGVGVNWTSVPSPGTSPGSLLFQYDIVVPDSDLGRGFKRHVTA